MSIKGTASRSFLKQVSNSSKRILRRNGIPVNPYGVFSKRTEPKHYIECEMCHGTGNEGTMINTDCAECNGTGWVRE